MRHTDRIRNGGEVLQHFRMFRLLSMKESMDSLADRWRQHDVILNRC